MNSGEVIAFLREVVVGGKEEGRKVLRFSKEEEGRVEINGSRIEGGRIEERVKDGNCDSGEKIGREEEEEEGGARFEKEARMD